MKTYVFVLLSVLIVFLNCSCSQSDTYLNLEENDNLAAIPDAISITSEPSVSDKEPDLSSFSVYGKFVCASDYFNDGEYFTRFPEDIPAITFQEDGSCELKVNYLQGMAIVFGIYSVEEKQVLVELDLNNTFSEVYVIDNDGNIFVELRPNHIVFIASGDDPYHEPGTKFMDDQYIFDIVANNHIIIDRGFYVVNAGDSFLKSQDYY
jgi:hypothetical protein